MNVRHHPNALKNVLAWLPLLGAGATLAQVGGAADGPPPGWVGPPPGWSGGVLAGVSTAPRFEGSRTQRVQPVLGFEMTYRSIPHGSVAFGNRGVTWTPVLRQDLTAGLALNADLGRIDSDDKQATLAGLRPGSAKLRGMGSVGSTPVLSAFATYALGDVSLTGSLTQATSSYKGSGLNVGLLIPWKIGQHAKLSIAPGATWADGRTMQAYFGVTPAQSAASGYATFNAGPGLKSAQVALRFEMAFSRAWHVHATLQGKRLLGDAADSPLTRRTTQASGMVGVLYQFRL